MKRPIIINRYLLCHFLLKCRGAILLLFSMLHSEAVILTESFALPAHYVFDLEALMLRFYYVLGAA